ncbi:MAG: transglycosylase SLT domain-containing protein [Sulfurospirillum sp.]|nr:transglycosylase SLT domain-containing protein [Sulfurospirillum sp.]
MLRILFSLIFITQGLFAFLNTHNNYQEQERVVKTFDIDPSFLIEPVFVSMNSDLNTYKTKHFLKTLENGYKFVPTLRRMIKEAGIPDAFLYLAMVESNFAATAHSSARAVGLWQFMPYTARKFGLNIDLYVDERRDPIKSTQAAIAYLKYLHAEFGKWYLAAIAYNCGDGRLRRAIAEAKSDDLLTLLDVKKKYLPRESRLYIRKILMMQQLSTNTDFIVSNDVSYLMNRGSSDSFVEVFIQGGTTLDEVAYALDMPLKELNALNYHLLYGFAPPSSKPYHIYIPYSKQTAFAQNFDNTQSKGRFYVYEIKKGDSLHAIAKKYRVDFKLIKDFNKLKSNLLSINQKLVIPVVKPREKRYTIKKGDTIGQISQRFSIDIDTILQANNKKNTMILPGETLVIPQHY